MVKKLLCLMALFIGMNIWASFEKGKAIFTQKCASCHKEYISFKKLKENFYARNNELLNLTIPTENMLAWAIMDGSKKIGDREDPEMQQIEIGVYLQDYLKEPDINQSICDDRAKTFYIKKEPMNISEEEAEYLALYFMGYKADRLKNAPAEIEISNTNYDEQDILKRALKEGKHLMVYATSESCYFCKKMDREVLQKQDIQDIMAEDYIFLKVDVDYVKLPFNLKRKFKGMTPTFFVLTPQTEILNIYPGAWVKDDFIKILKENL